ncbi:PulJ/GspJ family protein [Deinococcus aerophilus]|uniref:Prepilin-type N-terminal cleavage/methylation domain-containing protein n=1 Tax=Deinococcus aerophilus TaxID=522488 RepID=A0ABQ2GYP8_9DEIO|nr:type II secretion system protein [Deinococcus aerophilus]GGM17986.1 prepilin-type N-terminal cleavage/methylation domain-containing protein [Deinococcus aerophilus]
MKRLTQAGFTLLEMLVAMALIGIVLTALVSFFTQGSQASAQSSSRAELQQELLNAQQLISGKLREAWYVYPPGQTITMTGTSLTQKPAGGNSWLVGTDPILAMVLPPELAGGAYRFLAYYPVKRSVWVSGTGTGSWRSPGLDATNGDTWVLAEYRGTIAAGLGGGPPATPPIVPTSNTPNILSDYIAPTTATTGFTTTSPTDNTYTMFTYTAANGLPASAVNPVNSVTLNLATTRKVGGTTLRLPGAAGTYTISVYPTNLGKISAN